MKCLIAFLVLFGFAIEPAILVAEEEYSEEEIAEEEAPKPEPKIDEMPQPISPPKETKTQAAEIQNRGISEVKKDKVQSKDGKAPGQEGDFYRFFGDKISFRANDKFVYIKAGETTIVADAQGQVQIKAGGDLSLSTPGTVNISAGKDINLKAKGRVVTEGGGAKEALSVF
ncbi:MAG: hypothetical protein A3F16_04160 [Deltaproteobacteria bacterium RIFCSPHIGHO2_12_FULL_43_9]|nr:MAG: hypothetical protein A3F16_04160 [Deltaproteobacteria bacterium RIFCSPHIGHO2_12_FULL_43_9]